jgi:WD40 repeat protein
VNDVAFMGSGGLVSANSDGTVRFWRRNGSEARPALAVDRDGDAVFGLAVTDNGKLLAAATATDGVTLWRLDSRERGPDLNGQPADPLDVSFTGDGEALVTSNRAGLVTLWNARTGQSIGPRFDHHHGKAVWRLGVTRRSVIVTAGGDGTLAMLDTLDLERACELGAGSLDPRARARYLGDRRPVGCTRER